MRLKAEQLETYYQQELLQSQLEIQEQTFKNISQEIHDNVGQVLSLAKLNLNTMDLSKTEQLKDKIDNTLVQVSKAINDLRDLSKSFNTDTIASIGLLRAVENELEMIRKAGSLQPNFEITGAAGKIESQRELILFRIVQEVLNNIIKHAAATQINVTAIYSEKQLELTIADNGKGFELSADAKNESIATGLGIGNMNNRARLIGAGFSINSAAGRGTSIKITVPFESTVNFQHKTR
ncbi:MAG: ATP-binding protein [Bacteroidota bacterium]